MQKRKYWLDEKKNVSLLIRALVLCCGLLLVLDFVLHRHISHPIEKLPGFYPLYGFVGCVLLVIIAKWLRLWLMRDEDYYSPCSKPAPKNQNKDIHKSKAKEGGH